ncbi:hypothetical protein [Desulforhabdus amnigena]|jgi:hypothetical protein|uniref:Uncharacterized protein n=1 Tax=Desulforhabdus amnigena TaxID=40218 RepID=A0A9W6D3Y9_9BACT|nr:hypothetical protein [Desulforhabdus amnigena]NLJ26946.1 hypothetical protein [Deltaproteobacteria bacterium]GLI34464.1 hypothetical protein DAMNIGENAA_18970 [Desulforhabdus amnigena]
MKKTTAPSSRPLRGIAALFDDFERKEFFKKYLFFLGWVEVLILAVCWLYQLGDGGYDRFGPVEIPFPWKAYFLVSFLAPIAITFLIGMVVVGFNKYFTEAEAEAVEGQSIEIDGIEIPGDKSGHIYKIYRWVHFLRRLPFLALLLLLAVAVGFFYNLDAILSFLASVGEKSVKIFLISAVVLVALASVFALILIVLNYQLRKRSMEYQYKSEVAERFGLIILEDNTVLNRDGKLLINGKKWKETVPLLPAESSGVSPETETTGVPLAPSVDFKTS